jgi:hypothetical protein
MVILLPAYEKNLPEDQDAREILQMVTFSKLKNSIRLFQRLPIFFFIAEM